MVPDISVRETMVQRLRGSRSVILAVGAWLSSGCGGMAEVDAGEPQGKFLAPPSEDESLDIQDAKLWCEREVTCGFTRDPVEVCIAARKQRRCRADAAQIRRCL